MLDMLKQKVAEYKKRREREQRLAMANAFITGMASFDLFSPARNPRRRRGSRHSRRRRR